jgi:hypothetical protein
MTDVEQYHSGRPYGGVAVICKKLPGTSSQEIVVDNDRIIAVSLSDRVGLRQIIVNTYMPYFEGSGASLAPFMDCLDGLQACLDKYGPIAPIRICGDFNAQLPYGDTLSRHWYRTKGFSQQSKLLYDFITSNDLIAADIATRQSVKYTYFCIKSGIFTWIDHVLLPRYDSCDCNIVPLEDGNVSDHLPLRFSFNVNVDNTRTHADKRSGQTGRCNWKVPSNCDKYRSILEDRL